MSCAVPRELLSRYLDDDLSRTERSDLEEHLARCPDCRAVVGQYRALGAGVAAAVGALPVPTMAVPRARRRWLPAVAAVVALLAFAFSGGAAVAERLVSSLFATFEVQVLGKAEDEVFRKRLERTMQGGGAVDKAEILTLEEVEERTGWHVLRPTALPDGFALRQVSLSGGRVTQIYSDGARQSIMIQQERVQQKRTFPTAEGSSREALVKGVPAAVLIGRYTIEPGRPAKWDPDAGVRVIFEWEGTQVAVAHSSLPSPLTADDLVKIADSLE